MKKTILALVLLVFILCCASVDSGKEKVRVFFRGAHYGVMIKNLETGDLLQEYQADKSFVPASVMKLVTTATALEKMSFDYAYETKLGIQGSIVGGMLQGDLIIQGVGDPTLGSHYFYDDPTSFMDEWIEAVKAKGITAIGGNVVVDASCFDMKVIPDKWIWEDVANYYGAGCYGVSCFDNSYEIYFDETEIGQRAEVSRLEPAIDALAVESYVIAADNNRDNAYVYGGPWGFNKQIHGTIPAGRESFKIKGAMPNPPLVLARMMQRELIKQGIAVKGVGKVKWDYSEYDMDVISRWTSPSLEEIIRVTNKESNNLFAEHLLKASGVGEDGVARHDIAIKRMLEFWEAKGVSTQGVKVYDGSGLSRANLLTPQFIIGVIDYVSQQPYADRFFETLAVSGQDGTFRYFLDDSPLAGKVKGKSGGMSGVRCYAGVVEKSPTERYSFCIMVNNFTESTSKAREAIEVYLLEAFD